MPALDLVEVIHSSVEKNKGIPAMLDAYSEFVDSPIGSKELQELDRVFLAIEGNLSERFPQIASRKAATNAKNDISSFLSLANNDTNRVKSLLRDELRETVPIMRNSIADRFEKMNSDERRAIDATLRLVRRSEEEIMFRAEPGQRIETGGQGFQKFFLAVKSESPEMKELRYQNLIVEKGIFNKLLIKTTDQRENTIWVPSFFAKESAEYLIEKVGLETEHLFHSHLVELRDQGKLESIRGLLVQFLGSQGVLPLSTEIPEEIRDFVASSNKFVTLTPLELDDISSLFEEEKSQREKVEASERERRRNLEEQERLRAEESERQKQERKRATLIQVPVEERPRERQRSRQSIYLGKILDMQQFLSALNRKLPENEFASQVKADGDYYIELSDVKKSGITIVGSSGSGRSTTLRRLLDGMGSVASSHEPIIVIDQKGEHRGIAWKYKWGVYGFASDSQSKQFRLPTFLSSDDEGRAELAASILQEWLLQSGANCSDQQRERMASLIRAQGNSASLETVSKTFFGEKELDLISKKLSKGLLARNVFSRVFSEEQIKVEDFKSGKSLLFDVSGRGMRDPTTKEERLIASVLILKIFVDLRVEGYTIVLEDALDRFKSDNLRRRVISYVTELRNRNNAIVATSRAQVREFVGGDSLEILHRLSGEKILAEEVSGFKTSRPIRGLAGVVIFLPRGFAFTSAVGELASAAVRIEPLVFAYSTA